MKITRRSIMLCTTLLASGFNHQLISQEESASSMLPACITADLCSLLELLPHIHSHALHHKVATPHLAHLCKQIEDGATTAPLSLLEDSLEEALAALPLMPQQEAVKIMDQLTEYIEELYAHHELQPNESLITRGIKQFSSIDVRRRLNASYLVVRRNALINKDLTVSGTTSILTVSGAELSDKPLFITPTGTITQGATGSVVANGCQPGPVTVGTSDATAVALVTNGCTNQRLTIDANGAATIAAPSAGPALTVTGNTASPSVVIGGGGAIGPLQLLNVQASIPSDNELHIDATTGIVRQGPAGVAPGTIVNGCQPGALTIGTNNGTSLTLATGNPTCGARLIIAADGEVTINNPDAGTALTIGGGGETISAGDLNVSAGNIILPQAVATTPIPGATGLIELGTADTARNISIFEVGFTNLCMGNYTAVPNLTGEHTINIGNNANSTGSAANDAIAIGGGASTLGNGCIAIGNNAQATATSGSIVLGNASTASADSSMALGIGVTAAGLRSVAIGDSAQTTQDDAIVLGNSGQAAVAVGIGINAPTARLHVIGATGVPVVIFGADGSLAGAPVLAGLTPSVGTENLLAINVNGQVSQGATTLNNLIVNNCQPGPLSIGTSDGSNLNLSAGNGSCTNRLTINSAGNVTIQSPDSGIALTITTGGETITAGDLNVSGGNIILPTATVGAAVETSPGVITLGGASPSGTNINMFEVGNQNLFIGNYGTVPDPGTGTNNVIIGTGTSNATNVSYGVAIGNGANVAGDLGVAVGPGTFARFVSVAIGINAGASANDTIALGNGAQATGTNAIAIGQGTTAPLADSIILGNLANTAIQVGIGTNTPTSKLHLVGDGSNPVITLDQTTTAIAAAPVWLHPSTSGSAGTPIHYNPLSHQLFGFTSSRRYKENIRNIADESSVIYELNPVVYDSKAGHGEGKDIPGFIAEEVFDVAPQLAILNEKQEPENVAYNSLHALAIKEIQKLKKQLDEQNDAIKLLQDAMQALQTKLKQ